MYTQTGTDLARRHQRLLCPQSRRYMPVVPARVLDTRPGPGRSATAVPSRPPGRRSRSQVTGVGARCARRRRGRRAQRDRCRCPGERLRHRLAMRDADARLASNLNLAAGRDLTERWSIAKVGAGGKVCMYTQTGTDLVADINGYYARRVELRTGRCRRGVLETRAGRAGRLQRCQACRREHGRAPGHRCRSRRCPADAKAVVLNVTGVDAVGERVRHRVAMRQATPLASNLNLAAGVTSPNARHRQDSAPAARCACSPRAAPTSSPTSTATSSESHVRCRE